MGKTTLAGQLNDVGLDFDIAVKQATVTQQRRPATAIDRDIEKPGVARANRAVSTDEPEGKKEYVGKFKDYSVMQQHILFWDRDNDGQIYPWDTYVGFRELGFNIFFSLLAVLVINLNFSYPTRLAHSWLPDPWFRVYVDSVHKAKHGSDSGTYDMEGRFTPQSFENIFSKYDMDRDGALSLKETFSMMAGHRCAADPFGWGAAFFEFGTTWLLVQRDGKIFKEDLRGVYDGSIFWRIRDARKTKAGWNQGFGLGGDGFFGATKVA